MKIILLAGGGGTRLFPLSRARFPKQFLKVTGDDSLFAQTVQRFLAVTQAKDLVVITNRMHEHLVKAELAASGAADAHVVLEPEVEPGAGARLRIVVDDDGRGLSEAERAQVSRRGQRLDESKPGSGLGLSIVIDLAALYGGGLTLGGAPIGGLRAELRLPGA